MSKYLLFSTIEYNINNNTFGLNIDIAFENNTFKTIAKSLVDRDIIGFYLNKIKNELVNIININVKINNIEFKFSFMDNRNINIEKSIDFIVDKIEIIYEFFQDNNKNKLDFLYGFLSEFGNKLLRKKINNIDTIIILKSSWILLMIMKNVNKNFSKYNRVNTFSNYFNLSELLSLYNDNTYRVNIAFLYIIKTKNTNNFGFGRNYTHFFSSNSFINYKNCLLYLLLVADIKFINDKIEKEILMSNF